MTDDKPYKLPAPSVVANMCAVQAWNDHVDDQSRLLHEMSADTIRILMRRLVRQAIHLERVEATR